MSNRLFAVFFTMWCSFTLAQEINVYSARHYESDIAIFKTFTGLTGIKVNVIEGGASELIERILAERENSPADLLITADAGRLWRAEQLGLFQSVESPILDTLPENLRHPEGLWFGLSKRTRVIFYNPNTVSADELSSYEDLANQKWKGRICVRSSNHIYNQSLMSAMIEHMGAEAAEKWAEGIVSNFARKPQGGDRDQIKAVASGECDIAIANSYYYGAMLNSSDPRESESASKVAIFFPNQADYGVHINISGTGVLKHAPNPENAVRLIEYLISAEAQQVFAEVNNEYPVVDGVPIAATLQSWGNFKSDEINVSIYGLNNTKAVQIFDRVNWP